MKIAVIASKQDEAGMNIVQQLQSLLQFPATINNHNTGIYILEKTLLESDSLDHGIDADVFIFASKHVSKANVHSLTLHSIGNWGEERGGGRAKTLVPAPAALMKHCYEAMLENARGIDYEVSQEATHHGPYLEKPSMFIEIGSEERWKDPEAGKVIACTIIQGIERYDDNVTPVIAFGGLHYCSNFGKVMTADNLAVTYVCSKYMLKELDCDVIQQALDKSVPKASTVVLDWKGLGQEKERIVGILNEMDVSVKRSKEFSNI